MTTLTTTTVTHHHYVKAYVSSSGQSQVGVGPIRTVVEYLHSLAEESRGNNNNNSRVIIIGPCKLSPQAKNVIQQEARRGNVVEYFMEAELLFDITKHSLVPKHEILTPEQKKALLDKSVLCCWT